jgi:hypothetical protein
VLGRCRPGWGESFPISGHMRPISGTLGPIWGDHRPIWGSDRPISGHARPRWGQAIPSSGKYGPIWGDIHPRWGRFHPSWGVSRPAPCARIPGDTHTPTFSSAINAVVLNPSWYVPRSIAVREIFPKAGQDSSFLRREGVRDPSRPACARSRVRRTFDRVMRRWQLNGPRRRGPPVPARAAPAREIRSAAARGPRALCRRR